VGRDAASFPAADSVASLVENSFISPPMLPGCLCRRLASCVQIFNQAVVGDKTAPTATVPAVLVGEGLDPARTDQRVQGAPAESGDSAGFGNPEPNRKRSLRGSVWICLGTRQFVHAQSLTKPLGKAFCRLFRVLCRLQMLLCRNAQLLRGGSYLVCRSNVPNMQMRLSKQTFIVSSASWDVVSASLSFESPLFERGGGPLCFEPLPRETRAP
jgi:hypothetical protein